MADNIVLIGFMGVGKGQIARALAHKTSRFAVDCDDLIESFTNMKIKKIFSQYGETEFRKLEKKTAIWLEKNVNKTIISTGGGFFNVPNLKKIGTIIYLHASFSSIVSEIQNHQNAAKKIKKRPLLKDMDEAKKLYKKRLPHYQKMADLIIDVRDKEIAEIAAQICKRCKL